MYRFVSMCVCQSICFWLEEEICSDSVKDLFTSLSLFFIRKHCILHCIYRQVTLMWVQSQFQKRWDCKTWIKTCSNILYTSLFFTKWWTSSYPCLWMSSFCTSPKAVVVNSHTEKHFMNCKNPLIIYVKIVLIYTVQNKSLCLYAHAFSL